MQVKGSFPEALSLRSPGVDRAEVEREPSQVWRVLCGGVNTKALPASWVHPKWACEEEARGAGERGRWRQERVHGPPGRLHLRGCFLLLMRSFWVVNAIYACRVLHVCHTLTPQRLFAALSPSSAPLSPYWFSFPRMFPPHGFTLAVILGERQSLLCTQLPTAAPPPL